MYCKFTGGRIVTTILRSGHAAVSKTGQFIVDTYSGGFNLHDIEDGTYV